MSRSGATVRYAAYGSNLHPLRLAARVPSAELLGTSVLPGWALRFHKRGADGSAKCDIVGHDDSVHFAVYDLDERDKLRLDAVEGLGAGYEVHTLELPGFGEAFIYRASASHVDAALKPFGWYRALVAIGCKYHRFPGDYVARLASIETRDDPDPARHALHMDIVRRAHLAA